MATHTWRGHTIEVTLEPFGVFLWLVGGFVVKVDGRRFIPMFDKVGLKTETEFAISSDGTMHTGNVRSTNVPVFLPRLKYVLTVDGEVIGVGQEYVKRVYLPVLACCLVFVFAILACIGGAVVVYFLRHFWSS